jgi:hypothetical protein
MKMGQPLITPTYPHFYLLTTFLCQALKIVSKPAGGPAAKGAGGNTGQGQVRCLPRDGILERHFQTRFLGIYSSLLRIEFFLVFYPHFSVPQNAIHE